MDRRPLWMLALAACQFHPGEMAVAPTPDAPRPPADASRDAPDAPLPTRDTATAPACTNGALTDTFTSSTPCQPWGVATMNAASITEGTNRLVIEPDANQTTYGGCTAATDPTNFTAGGEFIQVVTAVTGGTAYTTLNAYPVSPATAVSATMVIKFGELTLQDNAGGSAIAMASYDAATMQWMRMRPVTSGTAGVAGDYSADGVTWTPLGVVTGTPPSTIRVDFGAGTDVGVASPGMAVLANLDTCP